MVNDMGALQMAEVSGASPLRILMVDDDGLILMNSAEMLEDMGYAVTSANSGAMALQVVSDGATFDLLITDFSMPRMDGVQLAVAVRALLPDLPIILATGYADLSANSELKLPLLSKPYMQSDLQGAINRTVPQIGSQVGS